MIFRPVTPVSPIGPPVTNRPVGLTRRSPSRSRRASSYRCFGRIGWSTCSIRSGLTMDSMSSAVDVLGREHDALDLDRTRYAVVVDLVADRHLSLPVRPEIGEYVRLAHLGQPSADRVRQHGSAEASAPGSRAGVTEHHPLVTRPDQVERIARRPERGGDSYDSSTPWAMSGDWPSIETTMPHVSASNPYFARS